MLQLISWSTMRQWVINQPAEVNNLSEKEWRAEYGEDEAEWCPGREEHGASHLYAQSLQVVGYSRHHNTLKQQPAVV
jgi:hypothetical protein